MSEERMLENTEAHLEALKDSRISAVRAKVPAKGSRGPVDCIKCGDEIQPGRRYLGYDICIHCAELRDRYGR